MRHRACLAAEPGLTVIKPGVLLRDFDDLQGSIVVREGRVRGPFDQRARRAFAMIPEDFEVLQGSAEKEGRWTLGRRTDIALLRAVHSK